MHNMASLGEAEALLAYGFAGETSRIAKVNLAPNSLARRADLLIFRFCLERGTDFHHVTTEGQNVLFALLPVIGMVDRLVWDAMDSIMLYLDAGLDFFLSDSCRCSCSPRGCDICAIFQMRYFSD
jgi:hypothetical protein